MGERLAPDFGIGVPGVSTIRGNLNVAGVVPFSLRSRVFSHTILAARVIDRIMGE
jgi:hypothetical protein